MNALQRLRRKLSDVWQKLEWWQPFLLLLIVLCIILGVALVTRNTLLALVGGGFCTVLLWIIYSER